MEEAPERQVAGEDLHVPWWLHVQPPKRRAALEPAASEPAASEPAWAHEWQELELELSSTKKKRRLKMNKHKNRKRRRLNRYKTK